MAENKSHVGIHPFGGRVAGPLKMSRTCCTHLFQANDGGSEAEGRDGGILQGFY